MATIVAITAMLWSASTVSAQVQNLCLLEIDGVVSGDNISSISTEEACKSDQPSFTCASAPCNNDSWGDLVTKGPPIVPDPTSGTGSGGQFSGVIATVGDQFTTGTKVTDPVSTWTYKIASGGPSKADLQQGMTATYAYTQSPAAFVGGPKTGDEILYYAVTRLANSGNELQGAWLFLNPVGPNPIAGTGKTAGFSGHHSNGDLYLLSAFTGGGGTVGIQVFQWQCPTAKTPSDCDSLGSLQFLASGSCTGGGNNFECGEVNDQNITVPGALTSPSTVNSMLAPGLFYNGGVDITKVTGGNAAQTPCFSTVMFESVSSPSCSTVPCSSLGNAAAKFFIISSFNTCRGSANKSCGAGTLDQNSGTAQYPIFGLISNANGGTLTLTSITDSAPGTIAGDLPSGLDPSSLHCSKDSTCVASQSACGTCTTGFGSCTGLTLAPNGTSGDTLCYQATFSADTTQCANGCVDTITAKLSGPAGSTVPDAMANANPACSFTPANANLSVTKSCKAFLVPNSPTNPTALVVEVDASITVCNTSAATLTNVTLSDSQAGTLTLPSTTLAPGACPVVTPTYNPKSLPSDVGGTTCPADTFQDTATAMGQCKSSVCQPASGANCSLDASTGTYTCTASDTASCPLCPLQTKK